MSQDGFTAGRISEVMRADQSRIEVDVEKTVPVVEQAIPFRRSFLMGQGYETDIKRDELAAMMLGIDTVVSTWILHDELAASQHRLDRLMEMEYATVDSLDGMIASQKEQIGENEVTLANKSVQLTENRQKYDDISTEVASGEVSLATVKSEEYNGQLGKRRVALEKRVNSVDFTDKLTEKKGGFMGLGAKLQIRDSDSLAQVLEFEDEPALTEHMKRQASHPAMLDLANGIDWSRDEVWKQLGLAKPAGVDMSKASADSMAILISHAVTKAGFQGGSAMKDLFTAMENNRRVGYEFPTDYQGQVADAVKNFEQFDENSLTTLVYQPSERYSNLAKQVDVKRNEAAAVKAEVDELDREVRSIQEVLEPLKEDLQRLESSKKPGADRLNVLGTPLANRLAEATARKLLGADYPDPAPTGRIEYAALMRTYVMRANSDLPPQMLNIIYNRIPVQISKRLPLERVDRHLAAILGNTPAPGEKEFGNLRALREALATTKKESDYKHTSEVLQAIAEQPLESVVHEDIEGLIEFDISDRSIRITERVRQLRQLNPTATFAVLRRGQTGYTLNTNIFKPGQPVDTVSMNQDHQRARIIMINGDPATMTQQQTASSQ